MEFKDRLEAALRKAGIKKYGQVAGLRNYLEAHGVSISTPSVHGWFSGKSKPDIDKLVLIAAYAQTSCEELLGASPPAPKLVIEDEEAKTMKLLILNAIQSGKIDKRGLSSLLVLANHLKDE